jgi:hypothetical protein
MAIRNARAVLKALVVAALASAIAAPAQAQSLLLGYWQPVFDEDQPERGGGPDQHEYGGLPLNQAMRDRGAAWDPSILTLPEHQCIPHPATYGIRGVGVLRIWEDLDPRTQKQVELHAYIVWEAQHRHIYMDGRPHPAAASPRSWQGFSAGRWEGDQLAVHTDHLKVGWIRRNGLALSDRATMDERFIRHGDVLTHVLMVSDPVYLAEPMIKTTGYRLGYNTTIGAYPCRPATEIPRARGEVPQHLPGTDDMAHEYADRFNLPFAETEGGPESALPETQERIAAWRAQQAAAQPQSSRKRATTGK